MILQRAPRSLSRLSRRPRSLREANRSNGPHTAVTAQARGTRVRHSIDTTNVSRLTVAWTYRTGEADVVTKSPAKLEVTPIVVDGVMYISTPLGRIVALDPVTGTERWSFDAKTPHESTPATSRAAAYRHGATPARLATLRAREQSSPRPPMRG